MPTLGDNLRAARERAGLTQKEAAVRAGVTPQAISGWERGANTPKDVNVEALAALYGVTAAQLRYGDVTAERHPLDRASVERPLPRVVRSHAVRVWLKEFELELTRAGVPEERIAEAIDLVTAPSVFRYFAGGAVREMDEERAVRAMETLARIVRMRAREEGYTVPEPST